jgi:hypothetical protein
MKRLFFVSVLLTVAFAAQAQLKIAPKMEKGTVKTYVNTVTTSIPMQGDVTVTSETNYSVVDATADGYLIDVETINVKVDADADNITGKLLAATEELQKGTVIHLSTDKDGKPVRVLNANELKKIIEQNANALIDKLMADIPQLAESAPKDVLKNQMLSSFTEETILRGLEESPLALNGKSIITGAQEEYVTKDGLKMKRMYFINGQNIIANSTLNMDKEEMKALVIKQIEERAPEQAEMVKENIDQILSSGILKIDMKQKDTYDLQADGWIKSMTTEATTETMGQKIEVKGTLTMK